MKFLVDAHLPGALCRLLRDAGHGVVHTRDLPDGNRTPDPGFCGWPRLNRGR